MTSRVARTCLLLVLVGTLTVGCRRRQAPNDEPITPAPVVAPVGPPATEQDCREYGARLEATVLEGDGAALSKLLRLDELCERCVSDLNMSAEFRRGALTGMKRAQHTQFSEQIINVVKAGGKYTFLRSHMTENPPRVVMRMLMADGRFNYHMLPVVRYPDGQFGAQDIHVLISGEPISQTIRRLLINVAAEQDRGLLGRLGNSEKLYSENIRTLKAMSDAAKQERHQEALNHFRSLPAALQRDKTILLLAIGAAQGVGEEESIKVLELFRQHHPNDPAIDILSIDYYAVKKQFDRSLQCLDKVDRAVGGDPYIFAMKGNVLTMAERYAEARTACERAVELEPTLEAAYWSRVGVALKEKKHADTLAWLKKVVIKCNVTIDEQNLKDSADYADFIESPQFKEFKTWYAARNDK